MILFLKRGLKLLVSGLCLLSLLLLAGCAGAGQFQDFEVVLEKVRSASSQVSSYCYHGTTTSISKLEGETITESEHIFEGAYVFPDREWRKQKFNIVAGAEAEPARIFEAVYIGNKEYHKNYTEGKEGFWSVEDRKDALADWLSPDSDLWGCADSMVNVEQLPNEKINGVECLHYKGKADMEKFWDWMCRMSRVETWEPEKRKAWEEDHKERTLLSDMTVELWIGEDDYLARRFKYHEYNPYSPHEQQRSFTCTEIIEFYDYNEAIEIEPPI